MLGFLGAAGSAVKAAGMGRYGMTAAGSLYGGAAGAAWGMLSSDTSMLGGAAMGAGLGAGGMRYGRAAMKGASRLGSSATNLARVRRGAGAALGRMKGDALLMSNKAVNGFSALMR